MTTISVAPPSPTKHSLYAGIVLTSNTAEPLIPRKSYPTATYPSDDDTKAAISEITTTVKTDSIYAHQQQELELAKQIIENQRQDIEKLKEEQDKSNEKYSNIVAMMNDRLQEQDSETATLKKEISTMILQQQNNHTQEMQDLYERMMRQMANMLSPLSQPESTYQTQDSTPEKEHHNPYLLNCTKTQRIYLNNNIKSKILDPPPQNGNQSPATSATTYTPPAVQHTSNHPPMEIECESPTIEDDV
jgi:flagellar biosynthesis GTPase FlhF